MVLTIFLPHFSSMAARRAPVVASARRALTEFESVNRNVRRSLAAIANYATQQERENLHEEVRDARQMMADGNQRMTIILEETMV